MNNGASQLRKQKAAIERELNKFSRVAAVEAKNWYKNSFRIGGFVDERYTRWRMRKNRDRGRAILVKTGHLRNSIKVTSQSYNDITISSHTPYGKFHNEGTRRLPKRQFMGNSAQLNRRIMRLIERMINKAS